MRIFLIVLALIGSVTATAAPVQWVLDEMDFGSGFTATGSFTFDADTQLYSNIDVTAGGVLLQHTDPGGWYSCCVGPPEYSDAGVVYFTDATEADLPMGETDGIPHPDWTDQKVFRMQFGEDLTNTGGTVLIQWANLATCADASCGSYNLGPELYSPGNVTSVPVPAAVWLFGSALAGLGWVRRKQAD